MTARLERIKQILTQRTGNALAIPVQPARVRNGKIPVAPNSQQPLLWQVQEQNGGHHVETEIEQPADDEDWNGENLACFGQLAVIARRKKRHDREKREPCGVHEAEVKGDEFEDCHCIHHVIACTVEAV